MEPNVKLFFLKDLELQLRVQGGRKPAVNASVSELPKSRRKQTSCSMNTGKLTKKPDNWTETDFNGQPMSNDSRYSYSCHVVEDHGRQIFGCKIHTNSQVLLATVGGNRVSIYDCSADGDLRLLKIFADPNPEEDYYACAWTDDAAGNPLLAAGGLQRVIRIFAPVTNECTKDIIGHGQSINDLTFHPNDPNLLLSASKDHSLRLWNIKTYCCVAVFGGTEGHRDEVISTDIDITGSRIVSCSMDHSLKVWKLNRPDVENAIQKSYKYVPDANRHYPTFKQEYPDFSTRDIHRNHADCIKWSGNLILSKSIENKIVCWKAGTILQNWKKIDLTNTDSTVIGTLATKDCDIWFMRFSIDPARKSLALGSQNGKIFVYDLTASKQSLRKIRVLSHPRCTSTIRQTAFSKDGEILICVCDDATVWRWDVKKELNALNNSNPETK